MEYNSCQSCTSYAGSSGGNCSTYVNGSSICGECVSTYSCSGCTTSCNSCTSNIGSSSCNSGCQSCTAGCQSGFKQIFCWWWY